MYVVGWRQLQDTQFTKTKKDTFCLVPYPSLPCFPSVAYQFPPEQFLNKLLTHESSSQGLFLGQSTKDRPLQGNREMEGESIHLSSGATEQNRHKSSVLTKPSPVYETAKETLMYRSVYGLCGRGRGWGDLGEWH